MAELFTTAWHSGLLVSLLFAILFQVLLFRALPNGIRNFRNNIIFGALCLLLHLAGQYLPNLQMLKTAVVLNELAILGWGLIVIRLSGLTLFRILLPMLRLTPPRILEDILMIIAYLIWGMIRLSDAGVELSGLVATSAVVTGIIAFSMQETLGNILGGLVLQVDNSVRIGDWIQLDTTKGRIVEVHWRYTSVLTNNGELIVIPNSVLMKSKLDVFSTAQHPNWRRWVRFTVSYPTPPQQVISAVEKGVGEAEISYMASYPAPQCIVTDYGDGFVYYALRYWLSNPLHDDTTDSHVRVHIYAALQRQGISLARPCLDVDLTTESSEKENQRQQQERQRRLKALKKVMLFSQLTPEELTHLADSLRDTPFTKGEVMTRQGATAHWLYLLASGEADVWFEMDNRERRHLTNLKAGDVFGEMGLMTGEPRRATVTARSDVECYRLDKQNFESILLSRPELAEGFARILSERNQQLMTAQQIKHQPSTREQEASILAKIRHFFRLGD